MIREIHLHGRLGKRFGKVHSFDVDSPAEAFRALASQFPGFREYVSTRKYVLSIGSGTVLSEEQLPMRLGAGKDIHLTPAGLVTGLETILLVGTLLFTAVAAVAVLSMPKVPTASSREEATKTSSYIFDGPQNNTEQGHPVPLIYGRFRVGSVVASAGINTTDVNEATVGADPTNPYGGGSYGGYVGGSPGVGGSIYGDEWTRLEKGGKGGSGTARSAQEDPNSLQSQATAKILDLLGEGEIVGLVDGLKSVYFDETPLQNSDDSFNFAGVAVEQRVGLPDQDFIPGFTQSENTVAVDTNVTTLLGPVTRTISDPDATVARVTIRLPQLYQQDTTNGDLKSTSVQVKISVQADGGGFTDVTTMTFNGKTNSGYQRSTDIRLPNGVERQIRVTRLTADSSVASLSNETRWDLLTEIVEAKLSYPDTALIGLTVDARQFGTNIPTRSYDVKGLIIEVPSNYNPETRAYTGIWDGTFVRAWTDNPAWVFRDLVVKRRYGLGSRVPPEAIDKWTLYSIAQYNDELIPDGFGGLQPRYTINCSINNPAAAYDVLASIASNFRGLTYWGSGTVVVAQDRPEDPSILVTPANVEDGEIVYGRITPLEKRRSVAIVYWNDPDDGFKLTPEVYEVPDLVRRFGRRTGEAVTAFGVTNRGQAHRMCRWIMEDEDQGSNATARYNVGDDHGFVEPGRIASIADPMYTSTRRGGRVKSANLNQIETDAPVTFAAGQDYNLRVTLPDGAVSVRHITNAPGTTTVISVEGPAYPAAPNPGAVWSVESTTVANRQFRIRSIETDEPPYRVQAVLHDPTKYDRVEQDRDISPLNFLDLPTGPLEAPSNVDAIEFLLQKGNAAVPAIQVSWNNPQDPRVTFFQAQYKEPGGSNWEPFADSVDVSRIIENAAPGEWSFRVRALDSLGNKTIWVQITETLDGQLDGLPNVTGLMVATSDEALTSVLTWTAPPDARPLRYEVLFNLTNTLGTATSLGIVDTNEFVISQPGHYWVRTTFMTAVSATPPHIEVDLADLPKLNYADVVDAPQTLAELDAAAQAQIDDLETTYGSTASAAASASAAATSLAAAEIARIAAQAAQTGAAAEEALAEAHKNAAASSASSASGSASAASGQATIATDAATAAATSQTVAAGHASSASSAASAASSSAAAASSSASTATSQASLSATYTASALNSVKATNPKDMSGGLDWYSQTGAFYPYMDGSIPTFRIDGGGANSDLYPKWAYSNIAGRKYRVFLEAAAGARSVGIYYGHVTSAINPAPAGGGSVSVGITYGGAYSIQSFDFTVPASPPTPYIFFYLNSPFGAGALLVKSFWVEDVTSEIAAASSASAAASSASTATAAGSLATSQATLSASFVEQNKQLLQYNRSFDFGLAGWTDSSGNDLGSPLLTSAAWEGSTYLIAPGGVSATVFSKQLYPVDPARKYRFKTNIGAYRNGASGDTSIAYAGFAGCDANGNVLDHGGFGSYRYCLQHPTTGVTWTLIDGQRYEVEAIVTGEGNDSWFKFPPGTKQIRLVAYLNYSGSAASINSYLGYLGYEDVTESLAASASASVASSASAAASAAAASAAASTVLLASLAVNAMNKNSRFLTWSDPGGFPEDWGNWVTGSGVRTRVAGLLGGYSVREQITVAGENMGFQVTSLPGAIGNAGGWFVATAEFTLDAGDLAGAGMYFNRSVGGGFSFHIPYQIDQLTGAVIGAGTVGRKYRVSVLFQLSSGSNLSQMIAMTGWEGGYVSTTVKTVTWHEASLREATPQEIRDQTVLAPLQATVTTHASAIATHDLRLATYLNRVAAGAGVAEVELIAQDSGGSPTSAVNLRAQKITLGSLTEPALEIVGGVSTFKGKLNVGGTTGARLVLTDNLMEVYDGSNVRRVRCGIW